MVEAPLLDSHKDRRTGLIAFGIVEILIGAGWLLLLLVLSIGLSLARHSGDPSVAAVGWHAQLSLSLLCVGQAAWSISLGIGSLRARRWARALILADAWIWLAFGMMTMLVLIDVFPRVLEGAKSGVATLDRLPNAGEAPPWLPDVVMIVMTTFAVLLLVVVPAMLVVFYSRRDVRATCERLDPQLRWSDRIPQAVLPMLLWFGGLALQLPLGGLWQDFATPIFGVVVSEWTGAIFVFTASVVSALLAWGVYRLKASAWWGALAFVILWIASSAVPPSQSALEILYAKSHLPKESLELAKQHEAVGSQFWITAVWVLIALAYLLFVRRHFKTKAIRTFAS